MNIAVLVADVRNIFAVVCPLLWMDWLPGNAIWLLVNFVIMRIAKKGTVKDEVIKLRPPGTHYAECPVYYKRNTTNIHQKPVQNLMPTYPTKTDYKAVFWFFVATTIWFIRLETTGLFADVPIDSHFNLLELRKERKLNYVRIISRNF